MSDMDVLTLTIHCTDRGQHSSLMVCRVKMSTTVPDHGAAKWYVATASGRRNIAQLADPEHHQKLTRQVGNAPAIGAQDGSRSWKSFTFDCPRCRRHVLVDADRMEKVVTELAAAGLTRVDLSHLERG